MFPDYHLITNQQTAEAVWVVLTEAGRRGRISENLGDDVAEKMSNVFEKIRRRLCAQLETIQWSYDEIVDFDVKISKIHKSSLFENHGNSPRIGVDLKIVSAGETEVKSIFLDFNESQLEEFIWKLKEAKAMRERIQKTLGKTTKK
ncbi:hypothetical protein L5515_005379 [Caenorhabditis briggsae]|uniref:COMM domain-containing protein n=1 Tax=Caenorhabditis briggsae TaxID=6238 RepID=A0AAE9EQD9_CAEBR|nr:hypothetical protein L5515_005379 [Caenorhabditis briggsae]